MRYFEIYEDLESRIKAAKALLAHPDTSPEEKAAARRALERMTKSDQDSKPSQKEKPTYPRWMPDKDFGKHVDIKA